MCGASSRWFRKLFYINCDRLVKDCVYRGSFQVLFLFVTFNLKVVSHSSLPSSMLGLLMPCWSTGLQLYTCYFSLISLQQSSRAASSRNDFIGMILVSCLGFVIFDECIWCNFMTSIVLQIRSFDYCLKKTVPQTISQCSRTVKLFSIIWHASLPCRCRQLEKFPLCAVRYRLVCFRMIVNRLQY